MTGIQSGLLTVKRSPSKSDRKGILQTWVMDADGRNQRNLSAKIGPDWGGWPTDWTHDGRILIATKGEV